MTTNRRLLIVAYNFPPAGGATFLRALKFAKYLPSEGWEVHVLTTDYREDGIIQYDDSLLAQLRPSVQVHRTKSLDLQFWLNRVMAWQRLRKKSESGGAGLGSGGAGSRSFGSSKVGKWVVRRCYRLYRKYGGVDPYAGWVPLAYLAARKIIRRHGIDVVLTTGPPHSVHLIGLKLNRTLGLTWVMDYRDAWSGNPQFEDFGRRRAKAAEQKCLLAANGVISSTAPIQDAAMKIGGGPSSQNRFIIIENGFDQDDFGPETFGVHGDILRIGYVGSLGDLRSPLPFLRGLREALNKKPQLTRTLRVDFTGTFPKDAAAFVQEQGLHDLVQVHGFVGHRQALRNLLAADIVLVILHQVEGGDSAVPAKIYEALGANRPVFGLVPPGPAASLLQEAGAAFVVSPGAEDKIADGILRIDGLWQAKKLRPPRPDVRMRFTRKAQTKRLASFLRGLKEEKTTSGD